MLVCVRVCGHACLHESMCARMRVGGCVAMCTWQYRIKAQQDLTWGMRTFEHLLVYAYRLKCVRICSSNFMLLCACNRMRVHALVYFCVLKHVCRSVRGHACRSMCGWRDVNMCCVHVLCVC